MELRTTSYFRDVVLPKRSYLTAALLSGVLASPDKRHVQSDGRVRLWKRFHEVGNRWVRVVLLADGETIHNAFLDRDGPPERSGDSA